MFTFKRCMLILWYRRSYNTPSIADKLNSARKRSIMSIIMQTLIASYITVFKKSRCILWHFWSNLCSLKHLVYKHTIKYSFFEKINKIKLKRKHNICVGCRHSMSVISSLQHINSIAKLSLNHCLSSAKNILSKPIQWI